MTIRTFYRWLAAVLLALPVFAANGQTLSGDTISTDEGDLIIHPIAHATLTMSWNDTIIYVDPVGGAGAFEGLPSPDLVLVTDIHGDHFNVETLEAVVESGTTIIAPQAVVDQMPESLASQAEVLANGEETSTNGMDIEAIPAYNLTEERLQFHEEGRGNGYVLDMAGTRVYIAGDTEDIPEMRDLDDINVAFIPFNLPYTMTEQQAADAINEFEPEIVYPYHYRGSDLELFTSLIDDDIEVRRGQWYED